MLPKFTQGLFGVPTLWREKEKAKTTGITAAAVTAAVPQWWQLGKGTERVVNDFRSDHSSHVPRVLRSAKSLAGLRLHGFLDLLLDRFQVEARALLHRRNSIAVWASFATSCCTITKRQNS